MDVEAMMAAIEKDVQVTAARVCDRRRLRIDRADFEQELRVKALQHLGRFNAEKSQWRSFVNSHIRWWASDIVRLKAGWKTRYGKRRDSDVCRTEDDLEAFERLVASSVSAVEMIEFADLRDFVQTLGRDASIWWAVCVEGRTMAAVAAEYAISESRVSQILSRKNSGLWQRIKDLVA